MTATKKRFSVIVATLNSERTIEACLNSLRTQDYPQDCVEILLIDGGSTDQTRAIAKKYNCRILENPDVVPVAAKLIGMKEATGDYLMHLDSDEVLTSKRALEKRRAALDSSDKIVMVFSAGYRNPDKSAFVNQYINEFGDSPRAPRPPKDSCGCRTSSEPRRAPSVQEKEPSARVRWFQDVNQVF